LFLKKKKNIKIEKEQKFKSYFEDWSKLVRVIYKNLTTNYLNPLGGTIFFDYSPTYLTKKGSILLSINSFSNNVKSLNDLSDGERSLVTLSIFTAFHYINSSPLIVLDELDSHLDPFNLQKFYSLFRKLEKKKGWNTIIITQKQKLIYQFSDLLGVYQSSSGSKIHLIKN